MGCLLDSALDIKDISRDVTTNFSNQLIYLLKIDLFA